LAEGHSLSDYIERAQRGNMPEGLPEGAWGVAADAAMAGGVVAVALSAVYVVLSLAGVV